MISLTTFVRSATTFGAVALVAACSDTLSVPGGPVPVNPLFQTYVALGNSITAGYQSGGINDSTQQESYARLFALQVHTRYAYASLAGNGCPAPVITFPSTRSSATPCGLRDTASIRAILNNVAVPGATSLDPTSVTTSASNALTMFILGGKTQVQKAADAQPTFVSAWIGNNDVLPAGLSGVLVPSAGVSPGITQQSTFMTNYNTMITGLQTIPSIRGGVLIGVVQVANAPLLFPAAVLANPTFKAGLDLASGRTITIDGSCTGSTSLISFQIISEIAAGTHPATIYCSKQSTAPLGDIFVLDAAEQTTLAAAITAYNAFIQSTATTLGWAYYDPNTTLATLKVSGCVGAVPNLADLQHTFGNCVSLDGIHPTGLAHKAIVNDLIDAVNAKYSTTIAHVA